MNAGIELERRLSDWLDTEAPRGAPDRLLETVLDRVDTTSQRWSPHLTAMRFQRLPRSARLFIAVASLVLLGLAIAVVGALLPRTPLTETFQAVIVRGEGPIDASDVVVVAVDPDGRERLLARFPASRFAGAATPGGSTISPGGWLVTTVMVDGSRSTHAVVDLRRPDEPARVVDVEGGSATWGPDERLAIQINAGGYATFDPLTGVSTIVRSSGASMDGTTNLLWARDGSGVVGGSPEGAYGVLELDGTFRAGPAAWFEDGVGTTVSSPTGTRLRCETNEPPCLPEESQIVEAEPDGPTTVWHEVPSGWSIVELTWGTGGTTVWAIVEHAAGAGREVQLIRLTAPGTATIVGTWQADPDDPDPSSYVAGASIAGIAPDGSAAAVSVLGGGVRLIDLIGQRDIAVDGSFAGWLSSTRLQAPRPPERLITPVPEDIRSTWVADRPGLAELTKVVIDGTRLTLDRGGALIDTTTEVLADGTIHIRQPGDALGCGAGSEATYRIAVEAGRLVVSAVTDPCDQRREILGGSWDRALPRPDTGSPAVGPGTYVGVLDGRRYSVIVPETGTLVTSSGDQGVFLDRDPEGRVSFRVFPVREGQADPCVDEPVATPIATPEEAIAHLASLPGVTVGQPSAVSMGAATGLRVTVTIGGATRACLGEHRTGLWPNPIGTRFRGFWVAGTNEIVFLAGDGRVMAVIATIGPDSAPEDRAWGESLLAGFELEP